MKVAPTARKRATLWVAALLAGLIASLTFAALPAAAAPVDPDTATETIQVWVRLTADKSGVPDVGVEVKGDGFDEKFTTGDDGKVLVGLPGPGAYSVMLDESTFPEGAGFANLNPQQKSVQASNKGVPAYFLLDPSNQASGATPTAKPAPTSEQNAASNAVFWNIFWSKLVTGIIFGLLLALAAIGLSLIYGTTGLNNFAHGELISFGGLMAFTFTRMIGLPSPVAIVLAIIAGGAFGYVQNKFIWKPLRRRGLGLVPLMIVTIGLSLALRYVFQFIWGAGLLSLPNDPSAFLRIGPVSLRFTDVAGAVIAIIVLLGVAYILLRTKIGKATRAVADNRSLAAASGIDVEGVIRTVWIGGAALAALSGIFIGYYQSLGWDTGASILLLLFAAVTLGGLGTAFGALIGSIVIGIFINISTIWIPENLKFAAALVIMILILLFRPQGILGRKDRIG